MNANEIVRALYLCAAGGQTTLQTSEWCTKAADLIESLQAQLAEYEALAAEYGIDGKTMLTLAESQIKTAKENIMLREALEESQCRERDAVEYLNYLAGGKKCPLCKNVGDAI